MIHPTAIIHPHAQLGAGTTVGPYAVIDEHVTLGANCVVGPHVHLTGHTTIGEGNRFHTGGVIGDAPQDFKYAGAPTRLRIGNGNIFREHVTVHRSNKESEDTGTTASSATRTSSPTARCSRGTSPWPTGRSCRATASCTSSAAWAGWR